MDDLTLFMCRKSSVSGNAKEVFVALWEFAGRKPGVLTEVTLARLTNFTGFSADALEGRIRTLEKKGLIERESMGRGVFRIYVYHPSPEKREETKPAKVEKPTPLFDSISEEDFLLPGTREIHGETHGQIHDEIHGCFHGENNGKHNPATRKELHVKTPPRRSTPPGGKYTLNNIKVKKEKFSSREVSKKPPLKPSGRRPIGSLFEQVDRHGEVFLQKRSYVESLFRVKEFSPDLIDRIAAGMVLRLNGFERKSLEEIKREALERQHAETIKYAYIHVANYIREVFEIHGYEWAPVRSARKARLERQLAGVR